MTEKKDANECSGALPLLSDNCNKCDKPSPGWHSCPYASEINDDEDPEYCNCCDDCTHECCMDI